MTLLELIIAASILLILASAALPVFRFTVVRQKEAELHRGLREMRDAIDRYKDYSDRNLIRVAAGSEGYPPDLETLVKGVRLGAEDNSKMRFLRRIPIDPLTGRAEWGLRSVQESLVHEFFNQDETRQPPKIVGVVHGEVHNNDV